VTSGRGKKGSAPEKPSAPRKRARITDEIVAKVKDLIEKGKSGAATSKAAGISLPSVGNIKKRLGLTKKRFRKIEREK